MPKQPKRGCVCVYVCGTTAVPPYNTPCIMRNLSRWEIYTWEWSCCFCRHFANQTFLRKRPFVLLCYCCRYELRQLDRPVFSYLPLSLRFCTFVYMGHFQSASFPCFSYKKQKSSSIQLSLSTERKMTPCMQLRKKLVCSIDFDLTWSRFRHEHSRCSNKVVVIFHTL